MSETFEFVAYGPQLVELGRLLAEEDWLDDEQLWEVRLQRRAGESGRSYLEVTKKIVKEEM